MRVRCESALTGIGSLDTQDYTSILASIQPGNLSTVCKPQTPLPFVLSCAEPTLDLSVGSPSPMAIMRKSYPNGFRGD